MPVSELNQPNALALAPLALADEWYLSWTEWGIEPSLSPAIVAAALDAPSVSPSAEAPVPEGATQEAWRALLFVEDAPSQLTPELLALLKRLSDALEWPSSQVVIAQASAPTETFSLDLQTRAWPAHAAPLGLCFGSTAGQLLGLSGSPREMATYKTPQSTIRVLQTFDLSSILNEPAKKRLLWEDLKKFVGEN